MEMTNSQLDQYKSILTGILKYFSIFCKKHNLRYWGAYGTVIGAVRHNGIIPWDDDIDVYMPREDYERLLSLRDQLDQQFRIFDRKDSHYTAPFAKIVDMNTTLWEYKEHPLVIGAYIDIFPLDYAPSSMHDCMKMRHRYSVAYWEYQIAKQNKSFIESVLKAHSIKGFYHRLKTSFISLFHPNYFKERLDALEIQIKNHPRSGKYISYYGPYKEKEIYEVAWFNNYVDLPFETTTIRIPAKYKDYLSSIYGDYMKLPPLEKRITHHSHYYFNLDCRMEINEIQNALSYEE